jgi:hypothetical protein
MGAAHQSRRMSGKCNACFAGNILPRAEMRALCIVIIIIIIIIITTGTRVQLHEVI